MRNNELTHTPGARTTDSTDSSRISDKSIQPEALTRRGALTALGTCVAAALAPAVSQTQPALPTRAIPRTGEFLPIVGLGSTRPVELIAELGSARIEAIVRALVNSGGAVIDTWPINAINDGAFGKILAQPGLRERLFVTINLAQREPRQLREHLARTMQLYDRRTIDLVNVGNLMNIGASWPILQAWRDEGLARYIGTTAAQVQLHSDLEAFVRRERPDFIEVNYSISERQAEQRLLPLCADLGTAVLVSRPFMNGAFFERLEGTALPSWAVAIECETWAQFSLQYILANPAVTCVLTETTNPAHMTENAMTALKPSPDERTRARMREVIDSL